MSGKAVVAGVVGLAAFFGFSQWNTMPTENTFGNELSADRQLIVLQAPSVNNEYYQEDFKAIVAFQKQYARTVLGNDNIVILVDADTWSHYDDLPVDILLEASVDDIWMRDFSTVHPRNMVQFSYDPSYFESREDAEAIQQSFVQFTDAHKLEYNWEDYVLDGGNIVDNGNDKLVTTVRFLEENNLSKAEAKRVLKQTIGVSEVAIIDYDDEVMGHADGMVMWTDEHTLLLNEYDGVFRDAVLDELRTSFSDVQVIEVPATITHSRWRSFNSACGVNLNAVVTHNHIYMPTFQQPDADTKALAVIKKHTDKSVHTIPAEGVCHMGGSVRCLSWQMEGENAEKLIVAARK